MSSMVNVYQDNSNNQLTEERKEIVVPAKDYIMHSDVNESDHNEDKMNQIQVKIEDNLAQ